MRKTSALAAGLAAILVAASPAFARGGSASGGRLASGGGFGSMQPAAPEAPAVPLLVTGEVSTAWACVAVVALVASQGAG